MIILILAAAAQLPLLPPEIARDLRCVAILAVAAKHPKSDPDFMNDGALFTAIVGANTMDATGESRETVRDRMIAQVRLLRAGTPVPAKELGICTAQMKARLAIQRTIERAQPKLKPETP